MQGTTPADNATLSQVMAWLRVAWAVSDHQGRESTRGMIIGHAPSPGLSDRHERWRAVRPITSKLPRSSLPASTGWWRQTRTRLNLLLGCPPRYILQGLFSGVMLP